ncbi:MAG: pitrilysin family protein [Bdellovibrionales bacterium]|nr:pitrilysin family protein [Bdellovibrionales bacterium]
MAFLFHCFFTLLMVFLFSGKAYAESENKAEKQAKNINKTLSDKMNISKNKKIPSQKQSSLINLKVEKYSLDNGMVVLLHQDRRIPQVYHQLLVKIGSRDEEEGKTGLAHLFEHMMFRGTDKYTGEEYEERLEAIGARNNAFTSRDYTAYEVLLPSHKLEMILEMESERLNSLRLTQSNFDKEKEVVKEERRLRTDNNPNEVFEPMMQLVFKSHPYRRPIIGWMKDLEVMTLDDCKEFYQSYYAPNNAILVLAGDFELEKAKRWIQKYYGALKRSQIREPHSYQEPNQIKQRVSRIERAISAPTLAFAYKVPKAGEDGAYSLEILNRVLVSGESSWLHQLLVYEHKLALAVGGFYYGLKEAGIFLVFVRMAPGKSLEKAKQLFLSEIKKTRFDKISETDLLKSSRSIMNDYISAVKSLSGKANSLSVNEAYFEDYRELFKDLDRYGQVTAQTIKEQANLYLSDEKVSIVELVPMGKK